MPPCQISALLPPAVAVPATNVRQYHDSAGPWLRPTEIRKTLRFQCADYDLIGVSQQHIIEFEAGSFEHAHPAHDRQTVADAFCSPRGQEFGVVIAEGFDAPCSAHHNASNSSTWLPILAAISFWLMGGDCMSALSLFLGDIARASAFRIVFI